MHDIDRTQRELEMEAGHEYEHEQEAEHEHESEAFLGSLFGEAEHEAEHEHEHEQEAESPLNETQEMELASELLEVGNEAELEYFFGRLIGAATRGIRNFARSSAGRAIGGALKGVARRALPIAGRALGGMVGGPIGSSIGGALGNAASSLFELELEGLSHEDREFEVARQVVRLGAAAAARAARAPRGTPPVQAARRAFSSAARVYAPGLLRGRRGAHCHTCAGGRGRRGGPGYSRRANGRVVRTYGAGGPTYVNGGPQLVEDGGVAGPADAPAAEPMQAAPDGDPGYAQMASRGGRWFRRGRNIVLTGL